MYHPDKPKRHIQPHQHTQPNQNIHPHQHIQSHQHIKTALAANTQNQMANCDINRKEQSKDKVRHFEHRNHVETKGSNQNNYQSIMNNKNNMKEDKQPKMEQQQLKINKKTSIPTDNPNGIQINVNIQNLITNQKFSISKALSNRSLSKKKKQEHKISKKTKTNKANHHQNQIDDFQCDEELAIISQPKTHKKLMHQCSLKSIIPNKIVPITMADFECQKQLRQFNGKAEEIDKLVQTESVIFLDHRQISYLIDPLYIQKKQKLFNWTMRAILMDWMMHISFQFRLKRETLYIALALVDNFFQTSPNLNKSNFQLAGATALFIAAKLQQFEPLSSKQFSKSTKDRYTAQQIKAMQVKMCIALRFNLNPPTINMWANKIMQQWDLFLDNTSMLQQPFFFHNSPKYFKRIDQDSYKNYRQIMQILDCAYLDIQTVQFNPKTLVCSLLYLTLGKQFGQFSKKKIVSQFPRTSLFFVEDSPFNCMFKYFLQQSFALQMFELLPSVQYLSTYLILPMNYDKPCLNQQDDVQDMHMQDYCSFQTYNPDMIATIRKRFRGIYQ